ncbi:hypothetical protein C4B68_37360 [Streptomyces dengpaensis]|uniref:Uncharacterized protein n=1 Tax=Streptomyces dengpaensis TaxID=2049881 RepID=A0ABM6T013_9ACTN|nr:hypothetical protein C4B68_37360 [Streptomyces dengpaensis]PIB07562.1 hypothetical protein B1C81_18690 [Streptomyces sp. HG99]
MSARRVATPFGEWAFHRLVLDDAVHETVPQLVVDQMALVGAGASVGDGCQVGHGFPVSLRFRVSEAAASASLQTPPMGIPINVTYR